MSKCWGLGRGKRIRFTTYTYHFSFSEKARKGQSGSWDTIKVTKAKKDGGLILGDGDEDKKKKKWVDWENVWEFKSTGFAEQSDTEGAKRAAGLITGATLPVHTVRAS